MSRTAPVASRATRWTLLALSMMTVMAGTPIASSMPGIREHFADVGGVELLTRLLLTIVGLSIAVTAPLTGWVVDRFGRKPVLVAAMVLYVLGGGAGLLVDSLQLIVLGRLVLGIAVGAIMIGTNALAADLFGVEERVHFYGQQAIAVAIGGVSFMSLGGLLSEFHWRAAFGVYLLGLAVLPALLRLPNNTHLLGGAGDDDAPRPVEPTPWALIGGLYALIFAFMLGHYLLPTELPFHLTQLGVTPAYVGFVLSTAMLASAVTSWMYPRFALRLRTPALIATGLTLFGIGWLLVPLAPGGVTVALALLLPGLGAGIILPTAVNLLARRSPAPLRGRIMAGYTSALFTAQFLSPLVFYPVVQTWGRQAAFVVCGTAGLLLAASFAIASIGHARRALASPC